MDMFFKWAFVSLLIVTSASHSAQVVCNRDIYPINQSINLQALGDFRLTKDECKVKGGTIYCKNTETKTFICLKCRYQKLWKKSPKIKDFYQCK